MVIFVMVVLTNHYSKLLSNLASFNGSECLKIEAKTKQFSFEQKLVIVVDQLKHLNAIIAFLKPSVI
jgi:hypothetical protein